MVKKYKLEDLQKIKKIFGKYKYIIRKKNVFGQINFL